MYDEIMTILQNRREMYCWKRRQLRDERRDLKACPEDHFFLPEVNDEIREVSHHINELTYLIEHMEEELDELRFMDELEASF